METANKSTGPSATNPLEIEANGENPNIGNRVADQGTTRITGKQNTIPDYTRQSQNTTESALKLRTVFTTEKDESATAPEIPRLLNPSAWPPVGFRVAYREYLAEFLGMFILIFMGIGVLSASRVTSDVGGFVGIMMGWGAAVAVGLFVSFNISGGHANPAVTFANAVWGRFPWRKVPGYFLAQFLGAFVGAAGAYGIYGEQLKLLLGTDAFGPKGYANIFSTYQGEDRSVVFCIFCEFSCATMLLFSVNAILDAKNAPARGHEASVIGMIISAIGLNLGFITGFTMNPARDFGPRVFSSFLFGSVVFTQDNYYFLVPFFVPYLGGIVGMFLYLYFMPENTKTAVVEVENK